MRLGEAERDPEKSAALLEEALSIFDSQLPNVPQAMRAPLMIARGGVLLRLTRHAEALEVADASLAEMPAEGAPTAKLREKVQRLAIDALMHTAIELDRAGRSDDAIEKIGQCYERIVQRDGSGAGGDDDEKMKGPV